MDTSDHTTVPPDHPIPRSSASVRFAATKHFSAFKNSTDSQRHDRINPELLSTSYPILSPVFCYVLGLNLVNSGLSSNPTIIGQIPLTASYGSLITNTLPISTMFDVSPGKYQFIEISIYDQNLQPLVLTDPEICINLVLSWDSD